MMYQFVNQLQTPLGLAVGLISACALSAILLKLKYQRHYPPTVPGLPLLGNLHQIKEKKPHKTFLNWAHKYGPIFKIKLGSEIMVVINSADIAKEAMITKYSSISTRKMSRALYSLTGEKTMVAMSDYGEEHQMLKKLLVTNLLGPMPQKANQQLRERVLRKMIDDMYEDFSKLSGLFNIRECLNKSLFPFAMYQVFGRDPDSVFVEELGQCLTRWEIYKALISDPLQTVLEVDWRDFFPFLKWVPNNALENKLKSVILKRHAIVSALITGQRKLLENGKEPDCYLDILLTQATHLSDKQLLMISWEPIIESSDTTLVTAEWAMYEIAKNPAVQERLFKEISDVAGSRIVAEDDLPRLKYLQAIVKETLRKYTPVALLPPRHVDEDTQLGGYSVKKGWQIIINQYAINHNEDVWINPEKWDPDRVLGDERLDLGIKDHRLMPFGTGKRICAGITQTMYIVQMLIAYFVQHFSWKIPPGEENESAVDAVYLTTHKLHPLEAIAIPRVYSTLPAS